MPFITACISALVISVAAQGGEPTTTTVQVVPGGPGTSVTVTVDGGARTVDGAVTLLDGGRPIAVLPLRDGTAALGTASLDDGAPHVLTAAYAGDVGHAASTSVPVELGVPGAATATAGTVSVTIPAGSLTLTSRTAPVAVPWPFGRVATTGAVVTDTRAGDLGFTVTVGVAADAGRLAVVTGLHAEQVTGNALRASDVRVAPVGLAVAGLPFTVARYRPGVGLGSVGVAGTVTSLVPVHVVWTVL